MKKRSIVILAPYVNGGDVGESWSNFQWVAGLSEHHHVTLLCQRRRGQGPIGPTLPRTRVIEWSDPPALRRFERFDSMLKPGLLAYFFRARRWLLAAAGAGEPIDLVHQLAPLAMRYPTPALGTGLPYVIGPVGGSLETPREFAEEMPAAPWYVRLRGVDRLRFKFDPALRATYRGAECVIGVAPYVRKLLGDLPVRRFEVASETAVAAPLPTPVRRRGGRDLRLLYVGRVIRTKGVRDAIRAVGRIGDPAVSLDVVGAGDDLAACRELANELSAPVRFHGKVSRREVDGFYRNADAFVFPSFREPSGNVVLEAMSHGLPMIVADRGGPGFVVDATCGVKVPITSPEAFADQIATAILKLRDPEVREKLASGAETSVREKHLWGTRIARMCSLYESIIDEKRSGSVAEAAEAKGPGSVVGGRALGSAHATAAGVHRT